MNANATNNAIYVSTYDVESQICPFQFLVVALEKFGGGGDTCASHCIELEKMGNM